jgi:hypothetical protein
MKTSCDLKSISRSICVLIWATVIPPLASGASWYVSPTGSLSGTGSIDTPWPISKALNSSAIRPGDTIYLRGGTYTAPGPYYYFRFDISGAPGAYITIRPFQNERAIINGQIVVGSTSPGYSRGWLIIRDLEITQTDTNRMDSRKHLSGFNIYTGNIKLINNIIHNQGQGANAWMNNMVDGDVVETYGNLIFHNGWYGSDRGHGHGAYQQNQFGQKIIADNIFHGNFHTGVHLYGENAKLYNILVEGNISFNSGAPMGRFAHNMLVTGGAPKKNITIKDNQFYYPIGYDGDVLIGERGQPCENVRVENNHFMGGSRNGAFKLQGCAPAWFSGNTIYGLTYGFNHFTYPGNTYISQDARPTGTTVIVRPNKYESGRANIAVYNWERKDWVTVDLSSAGLSPGDSFEIRDVQNYFGEAVVSGVYSGSPVTLPMTSTAVSQPVGAGTIPTLPGGAISHTDKEFGAFIVRKTGAGDTPPPGSDTSAPSSPANLSVLPISSSQLSLSWAPSVDNKRVTGYKVFRNGHHIGSTAANSYADAGLAAGTTYVYTVSAFDAAGNESAQCVPVSAATLMPTDTDPPKRTGGSPSGQLPAGTTSVTLSLSTDEPASCRYGTGANLPYGNLPSAFSSSGSTHTTTVTGLKNGENYRYYVRCTDAAGNANADDWSISFSVATASVPPPSGKVLYNGIVLPSQWPPAKTPTQTPTIPAYITNPPPVVPINLGRQLFVDDFLIESTTLTRKAHRPTLHSGNPVFHPSDPADSYGWAQPFSDGIWYDPSVNKFRMWYFADANAMSLAESTDGVNWSRPNLTGIPADANQLLDFGGGRDSSTVWLDSDEADPQRRYKAWVTVGSGNFRYYTSANGINWTFKELNPLRPPGDRSTMFYNPFRKVWVLSSRSSANLPPAPGRGTYASRTRNYYESPDLINWSPSSHASAFWTGPDANDPGYPGWPKSRPELYNLDAIAYESLMVGFFSMYYERDPEQPSSVTPDITEINVGFSRDGYNWVRPTRAAGPGAFIPAANDPNAWDGYNSQSVNGGLLVVGDELWIYYSGRDVDHNGNNLTTGKKSTGLAKMRRDGFYSMNASSAEGALTTRPVTFSGKYMFVNVKNPSGSLRVEVLDKNGNVIEPFTRSNSATIAANSTKHQVTWAGADDLSALAGQAVKFKFYLADGELYSFWVTSESDGASFGYVGAGGPGFATNRDLGGQPLPLPQEDKEAPTVPAGLSAVAAASSQIELEWSPSVDNVGVAGYRVFKNGTQVATVVGTSYQDRACSPASTNVYEVAAYDDAGNMSSRCARVSATTPSVPSLAAPGIAPKGGSHTGSVLVTLSSVPGSTVYYTLDGTPPSSRSSVYTSAIQVAASATLKAIAVQAGFADSTVSSAAFTISQVDTAPQTSSYYQTIEAESDPKVTVRPWERLYSGPKVVSGGYWIRSSKVSSDAVSYTFTVPADGTYKLWGRGSASSPGAKFYVSIDGQNEQLWSIARWRGGYWQWDELTSATGSARLLKLTPGPHTVTIRTAKAYSYLDLLMLTNDLSLVPSSINGIPERSGNHLRGKTGQKVDTAANSPRRPAQTSTRIRHSLDSHRPLYSIYYGSASPESAVQHRSGGSASSNSANGDSC